MREKKTSAKVGESKTTKTAKVAETIKDDLSSVKAATAKAVEKTTAKAKNAVVEKEKSSKKEGRSKTGDYCSTCWQRC